LECLSQEDSSSKILSTRETAVFFENNETVLLEVSGFAGFESITFLVCVCLWFLERLKSLSEMSYKYISVFLDFF